MMKVSIHWFDGTGNHARTERTTLSDIENRCADAHCSFHAGFHGQQLADPQLLRVFRLVTGEVARIYRGHTKAGR